MRKTIMLQALMLGLAISSFSFSASSALVEDLATDNNSIVDLLISQKSSRTERRPWWKWILGQEANGTRGDICLISPNKTTRYTYSNQPSFVWKVGEEGAIKRIEIYDKETNKRIWNRPLTLEEQRSETLNVVSYDGEQLIPGRTYYYAMRSTDDDTNPAEPHEKLPFELIPSPVRESIQKDLENLKPDYPNISDEDLTWKRIEYFSEFSYEDKQGLFLDVIREFFSLPQSEERETYIKDILTDYCRKK